MTTIREHLDNEGHSEAIIASVTGVDLDTPWTPTMKGAMGDGEARRRIDRALNVWSSAAADLRSPKVSAEARARLSATIERARAELTAALIAAGAPAL